MFASATLKYIQAMAKGLWKDEALLARAKKLQQEIDTGIKVCSTN
jgi:meiotically up-regulated gene 157 (Mug157) protein